MSVDVRDALHWSFNQYQMIRWKNLYRDKYNEYYSKVTNTEKYTFANIRKDIFTIIDIDTFVYI